MNPVQEGGNQFAELFKAMPAGRIGNMEDIAGAILYLSSQAGVSWPPMWSRSTVLTPGELRLMSMGGACVLTVVEYYWPMGSNMAKKEGENRSEVCCASIRPLIY